MLTVEEAREKVLASVAAVESREVPLVDAGGAVLASDVAAPHDLQRFDNSSMDGYAIRSDDVAHASEEDPAILSLIGEIRAGESGGEIGPATAMRIMTGAPLPEGADGVAPIEVAEETIGKVSVRTPIAPGQYVRRAGEDVRAGELILRAGTELGAGELAMLASLGVSPVPVYREPRVAALVTGDELVAPEATPEPGQIRDSNTVALRTLVEEAGAKVVPFEPIPDDRDATLEMMRRAAQLSDLIVSAGGVSVGRYDYVKEVVEELGHISFWRVAMQPGKPLVVGEVASTPFIGLPGNPVSVHVGFEQFVRPAIRKMRGYRTLLRPRITALLTEPLKKPEGRLHFVRVALEQHAEGWRARPTGPQGSHIQSSLLEADGLALFDREKTFLEAGTEVTVEVWRLPG